jgi:hypothetical protein
MDKCPSCDFADGSLGALLLRIDDCDLLITLACDFAERVADLTPDPSKTREWLQAARVWETDPEATNEAREAASAAANVVDAATNGAAWAAANAVSQAAWSMVRSAIVAEASAASAAINAAALAESAVNAADAADATAECEWQLVHVQELACTCPAIPEVGQPGPRGRNSLLAH